MPQSLARLHYHLVFSTKQRTPWIDDFIRADLHEFMRGTQHNLGCYTEIINSMEDHVHVLFRGSRTVAISSIVEDLKTSSSKWIKRRNPRYTHFHWQNGYAIFAVSESVLPVVRNYIANQQEHHKRKSFQDEYRQLLQRNSIEFDERYVWD